MKNPGRVYRFSRGCGCSQQKASRPIAKKRSALGGGCIRNPRTSWALGLHSCRALSSQPQSEYNLFDKSVTHVPGRKCYPCIGTFTALPCTAFCTASPRLVFWYLR